MQCNSPVENTSTVSNKKKNSTYYFFTTHVSRCGYRLPPGKLLHDFNRHVRWHSLEGTCQPRLVWPLVLDDTCLFWPLTAGHPATLCVASQGLVAAVNFHKYPPLCREPLCRPPNEEVDLDRRGMDDWHHGSCYIKAGHG